MWKFTNRDVSTLYSIVVTILLIVFICLYTNIRTNNATREGGFREQLSNAIECADREYARAEFYHRRIRVIHDRIGESIEELDNVTEARSIESQQFIRELRAWCARHEALLRDLYSRTE